ncbi:DUF1499 domain-containing protein [uncultured Brevundimonas sp.]|uniref:DUF1499 domain-containing protein n=1 Tax=uncultured Brevundimonas sp. TaxID=213418 RepID=UPI00262311BA|nr:DUF1499 domain-containing protein [uncultured Brevundimonas sp.]
MAGVNRTALKLAKLAVFLAVIAPLVALVAVLAVRMGLADLKPALQVVTLRGGLAMAWIGGLAGVLSILLVFWSRPVWPYAATALVVGLASLLIYQVQAIRFYPAPRDVASDLEEPPAFGRQMLSERRAERVPASQPQKCDGLEGIDSQLAPEVVAWGMKQAGLTVMGTSPFRVEGWQQGMWFGIQHDVTVRIRPGRTDIRVAGRDQLAVGPRACDLAKKVVAEINALR